MTKKKTSKVKSVSHLKERLDALQNEITNHMGDHCRDAKWENQKHYDYYLALCNQRTELRKEIAELLKPRAQKSMSIYMQKAVALVMSNIQTVGWNEDYIEDQQLRINNNINTIIEDELGALDYDIEYILSLDLIKKITYRDSPAEFYFARRGSINIDLYVGDAEGSEVYSDETDISFTNQIF